MDENDIVPDAKYISQHPILPFEVTNINVIVEDLYLRITKQDKYAVH